MAGTVLRTVPMLCLLSAGCVSGRPAAQEIRNGVVLFTFDDCDIAGWTNAIPLFEKYNAHATFFFVGNIDDAKIGCMKKLKAAGHSIGLHTVRHADAPAFILENGEKLYWDREVAPQLEALGKAGLETRNFAFPNNRKDEVSIALLQRHFKRFRAGCNASLTKPETPEFEQALFPVHELKDKTVFGGFGVGEYYKTSLNDLLSAIEKASRENKVLVIFSHAIAPGAKRVHMPLEYLTAALEKADALGMAVIGFDDIDELRCGSE